MSAVDDESGRNVVAVGLCVVLATSGVLLGLGGLKLLMQGGSVYFLCTGVACVAAALMLWFGHAGCLGVYAAMLAWTLGWSLWQVGLDFWALAGRLGLLFALGMAFWLPPVMRWLAPAPRVDRAARLVTMGFAVSLAGIVVAGVLRGKPAYESGPQAVPALRADLRDEAGAPPTSPDWPYYGNDAGGTHYSSLAQIRPDNVAGLRVAWTYRTGEWPAADNEPRRLEVTPLKVGDSLYLCSARGALIALDIRTGRERWRHDPHADVAAANAAPAADVSGAVACRGVAHHVLPRMAPDAVCAARIYGVTPDARLLAVDARTGAPCPDFGRAGQVDMRDGASSHRSYHATSVPQVVRGRVVLGGWLSDGQSVGEPGGRMRAYDARTGALVWSVDPDEAGPGPRPSEPNAWAPISADEALGMIYVPTGNVPADAGLPQGAQPRRYGTVLALDADTGQPRWTFQARRHALWDYDVASQPVLTAWPGAPGQGRIPALVQVSKRGQVFVLDRRTGEPLPVPALDMGAQTEGPLRESDMWGLTPFDHLWCRLRLRQAAALQTARVSDAPHLDLPAAIGGVNWGGVALDPHRGVLVLNWARLPLYDPPAEASSASSATTQAAGPFLSPLGAPCAAPPYGHLTAVDLRQGRVLWQARLGSAYDSVPLGLRSFLPIPLATRTAGGALITGTGLVFTVAAQEQALRAVDVRTGDVLWQDRLPAGGQAAPMAYQDADGRAYVVIAAGGHPAARTRPGDYLIAYALP